MAKETKQEKSAAEKADAAREAGHKAELERQAMVTEAVKLANAEDLPKLGGTPHNPGLGE